MPSIWCVQVLPFYTQVLILYPQVLTLTVQSRCASTKSILTLYLLKCIEWCVFFHSNGNIDSITVLRTKATVIQLMCASPSGRTDPVNVRNTEATCHAVHVSKSWLLYTQVHRLVSTGPHFDGKMLVCIYIFSIKSAAIRECDSAPDFYLLVIMTWLLCTSFKPCVIHLMYASPVFPQTSPPFVPTCPHIGGKVLVCLYNNL